MDRRVGRAADRGVDADRVDERLARQDVGRLAIRRDHLDDLLAGEIGAFLPIAQRRGNGGRAGQRHAERFGQAVHRRRRAHGVAVTGRRRRGRDQLDEALIVDLAGREQLARAPHDRARSRALAFVPAVEHRPDRQRDRRHDSPSPPPSGRPAWSCRSRSSAPRRRADSRTALRPARDRRGCDPGRRSAACRFPGSDAPETPARCRRLRACLRARARRAPGDGDCRATGRCRSARCR